MCASSTAISIAISIGKHCTSFFKPKTKTMRFHLLRQTLYTSSSPLRDRGRDDRAPFPPVDSNVSVNVNMYVVNIVIIIAVATSKTDATTKTCSLRTTPLRSLAVLISSPPGPSPSASCYLTRSPPLLSSLAHNAAHLSPLVTSSPLGGGVKVEEGGMPRGEHLSKTALYRG